MTELQKKGGKIDLTIGSSHRQTGLKFGTVAGQINFIFTLIYIAYVMRNSFILTLNPCMYKDKCLLRNIQSLIKFSELFHTFHLTLFGRSMDIFGRSMGRS